MTLKFWFHTAKFDAKDVSEDRDESEIDDSLIMDNKGDKKDDKLRCREQGRL